MADNIGGDRPSSDTIIPSKSSTSDEQKNISASTNKASEQQPRAKINISLKQKKKKSKSTNNNNSQQLLNNNNNSLLADEYSTIAEEAEIISKRRKEEGDILVIPCKQQKDEDETTTNSGSKDTKKKQPLLARRLALLRQGDNNGIDNSIKEDNTKEDNTKEDEDEAVKLLIQSAEQKNDNGHFDTNDKAAATSHGRGLVIAAPSENKLTTRSTTDANNNNTQMMNDEQVFQHELAHHAADVDPTSNVYANVSIGDFGSALLRGMGWTGGGGGSTSSSTNNKSSGGNKEEQVKPRPHRLGLGAKPVPLPSSSTSSKPSSSGGIHRRARRPEDVKRDEERLKQQEEEEKRIIEKKKLDVQYTLQNGSIVTHRDVNDSSSSSQHCRRALIVQTAGVPGLNRILIQFEGESKETSVTKGSVKLCSWDELKQHPFKKIPLVREKKKEFQPDKIENGNGSRKRDRSYSDDDDDDSSSRHDDERRRSDDKRRRERSRRHSDDESDSYDRRRSKKHKQKKRDRRSRSRSDSRERTCSKRRKESRKDKRRDRSRSPEDYHSSRKRSKNSSSHQHDSHNNNSASTHWLIPNIRVRLISKKIPKYYLQKGIVQDVMKSNNNSSSGPKAVLQMDINGQVIDKVPERYLETALPKTGGIVIILESKDKTHHWKKGRLLEKSSKDGYGIVQLEEDLEVVKISLDGLAEWCGRMDD